MAAALADRDRSHAPPARRIGMHQRVVEHDVGAREQARRAYGQEVGRARSGADEVDVPLIALSAGEPHVARRAAA